MLLMPRAGTRSRSRRRVAAISLASFLALFGYEAARMHNGDDPALAQTKKQAATTQSSSSSSSESQNQSSTPSNNYGDGYSNGSGDSAQNYYTPPQNDAPSTGSS
jgi:hypothetical protein